MRAIDAALEDAARGWFVLPLHHPIGQQCSCGKPSCPSAGKHPRVQHGVYDSSVDPIVLRDYWRRWPRANVGIATGLLSGFDVLDVDPRNSGEETLAELIQQHGPMPQTVEQITGGGGRHLLFAYSSANLAGKVGTGLDVRSDGDLIVAPPSLHVSGNSYAWELSSLPDETPVAPWPTWLLQLLTPTTPAKTSTGTGHPIPMGTWSRVLAGCKRLRELLAIQKSHGVSYEEWLAVASVARLGGPDGQQWAEDFTAEYAPGASNDDWTKMTAWLAGNLAGTGTCASLGCHPGICGFRPRTANGQILSPSPLRHAWGRIITVEVA